MQNIQTNPLLWSKSPFKVCLPKVGNIFKVKQNLCLSSQQGPEVWHYALGSLYEIRLSIYYPFVTFYRMGHDVIQTTAIIKWKYEDEFVKKILCR